MQLQSILTSEINTKEIDLLKSLMEVQIDSAIDKTNRHKNNAQKHPKNKLFLYFCIEKYY